MSNVKIHSLPQKDRASNLAILASGCQDEVERKSRRCRGVVEG